MTTCSPVKSALYVGVLAIALAAAVTFAVLYFQEKDKNDKSGEKIIKMILHDRNFKEVWVLDEDDSDYTAATISPTDLSNATAFGRSLKQIINDD